MRNPPSFSHSASAYDRGSPVVAQACRMCVEVPSSARAGSSFLRSVAFMSDRCCVVGCVLDDVVHEDGLGTSERRSRPVADAVDAVCEVMRFSGGSFGFDDCGVEPCVH